MKSSFLLWAVLAARAAWGQTPTLLVQTEHELTSVHPASQTPDVGVHYKMGTKSAFGLLDLGENPMLTPVVVPAERAESVDKRNASWVKDAVVFEAANLASNTRFYLVSERGKVAVEVFPREQLPHSHMNPVGTANGLVYLVIQPDGTQVGTYSLTGHEHTQLTKDDLPKKDPSMSPQGDRVVYAADNDAVNGFDLWEVRRTVTEAPPSPETEKKKRKKKKVEAPTEPAKPVVTWTTPRPLLSVPDDQISPQFVGDDLLALQVDAEKNSRIVRIRAAGELTVLNDQPVVGPLRADAISPSQQWVCWMSVSGNVNITNIASGETTLILLSTPMVRAPVFDPRAETPHLLYIGREDGQTGDGVYRIDVSDFLTP